MGSTKQRLQEAGIMIGSALISAVALNEFLIPGKIFSAGINGISQILAMLLEMIGLHVSTGWFILLFNVPIGLLGWFKIGRRFTLYSIIVAVLTSILTIVLPVYSVAHNALLAALFGGILAGISIGYPLKYGFSTGGMDIVSVILERTTGRTIGTLMLMINLGIILVAGSLFGWQSALYTIISIYAMSRVVDGIHTRHQKMTALVVTTQEKTITQALNQKMVRGITIMPAMGAYQRKESSVLMIVISRYELYTLEQTVKQFDPQAFINVLNTVDIAGKFYNEREQSRVKQDQPDH